jgi:hypothetical protein
VANNQYSIFSVGTISGQVFKINFSLSEADSILKNVEINTLSGWYALGNIDS